MGLSTAARSSEHPTLHLYIDLLACICMRIQRPFLAGLPCYLQVFLIPIALPWVLRSAATVATFDTGQLFRSLVLTVLLPLLAGIAAQAIIPGECGAGRPAGRQASC